MAKITISETVNEDDDKNNVSLSLQSMQQNHPILTIAETTKYLKINRKTIDDALKSSALKACYPSKGTARITVKQLEE